MKTKLFIYILLIARTSFCLSTPPIATDSISTMNYAQDTCIRDSISATKDSAENKETFIEKLPEGVKNLGMPKMNDEKTNPLITPRKILWTIIFILIGYLSISIVVGFLDRFAEKSTKYRIVIKRTIPVIKIVGWIIVIFIIIQGIIKPPAATVFAFFTSIGVAVGFAAQDLLKNVFGGLMILFDHPFQVGDKIDVGGNYGEVKDIGLRSTRIITPDDSMVSLPNSEMMNSSISNSNVGETNCQVVAEIYLPIDIDTQRVRKIAIESAQVSNYIYLNKPIAVVFINEMHDRKSILKMRLKAYVSDIRHEFAFKSDMTEIVLKALIEEKLLNSDQF